MEEIEYLTADEEENFSIAQANNPIKKTGAFVNPTTLADASTQTWDDGGTILVDHGVQTVPISTQEAGTTVTLQQCIGHMAIEDVEAMLEQCQHELADAKQSSSIHALLQLEAAVLSTHDELVQKGYF